MWRREDVVEQLRKEQGKRSMAEFAKSLGVTPPYLCGVYQGKKDLGPTLLEHLNLERKVVKTVTYVKRRWR